MLRHGRDGRWFFAAGVLLLLALALLGSAAEAQAPPASGSAPPSASAPVPASASSAIPLAPRAPADPRIARIRALVRADLDVAVQPQDLFDVPLDDAKTVDVERVRLRALFRIVEASVAPSPEPAAPLKPRRPGAPAASTQPVATPASSTRAEIAGLEAPAWDDRLALDRARLDFYELPAGERADLLRVHKERQAVARSKETEEEQRAREDEAERQRALRAAAQARSEAERLVAEETARVIGVGAAVQRARAAIVAEREDLAARRDRTLGWQRRARDAKTADPATADDTYKALRVALRSARDALAGALDAMHDATTDVPSLGPDPTTELDGRFETAELRERRAATEKLILDVRSEEREWRAQRPAALQEEISALNRERLGLLPSLSPALRSATTGFTEAGLDQARSEARHLILILRYHRETAAGWLRTLRDSRGREGISAWGTAAVLVPWAILVAAFAWVRRRSPALLAAAHQRLVEQDRSDRRTVPSLLTRFVVVARGVHRTLEWLAFFGLTVCLVPATTRGLLEVQILIVIVGWTLGAALVVDAINAVAAAADVAGTTHKHVAQLRLRSLRLVGRVFVIFALILVLSARLVGEGTLYSWTISTCWLAAIPVFLIVVRWWRDEVFERVAAVRRKSRVEEWILAHRRGWTSFLGAMVGAVQLFSLGAYRTVRRWVTSFDIARRAHAYLFKRGLDRMAEAERSATVPLRAEDRERLAPDVPSEAWIACPADQTIEQIEARLERSATGVVAIIGAIGMGKTTLMRRLEGRVERARGVACDARTTPDDLAALLDESAGEEASSAPRSRLVLLDEAHALVRPVSGGLLAFDAALAFARARCDDRLWVFAIDRVVWPFLQRARDARPLFDDVLYLGRWSDESIGQLLLARCASAGMTPTFEDLLDKLPSSADDVDKQEALAEKRTGYFRMVWDYARGNPALALEAWRSSLVEGSPAPQGAAPGSDDARAAGPESKQARVVRVRPLHTPPQTRLESLPDPALFILRAVLQLSRATVTELATATRMSEVQVQDAVSFGVSQGYYAVDEGVVRVTWSWLRSVIVWLERRHLLVEK